MNALRVVYVAGWMRSGTTLTSEIVGSFPGALAVGELSGVWGAATRNQDCSCGTSLRACPVWSYALRSVEAEHGLNERDFPALDRLACRVLRTRDSLRLASLRVGDVGSWPTGVRQYVDITRTLIFALAEVSGATVLVDSSKLPPGMLTLRLVPNTDICVVHVVRDPRAVASSELRTMRRPPDRAGAVPPGRSPLRSAVMWQGANLAVRWSARKVGPYARLRYEDLVSRPTQMIGALGEFVGLEPGLEISGDQVSLRESHVAVGNPSRMDCRVRTIRSDNSRNSIRGSDKALVDLLTFTGRHVWCRSSLEERKGDPAA